jgi:hypothetical protein
VALVARPTHYRLVIIIAGDDLRVLTDDLRVLAGDLRATVEPERDTNRPSPTRAHELWVINRLRMSVALQWHVSGSIGALTIR